MELHKNIGYTFQAAEQYFIDRKPYETTVKHDDKCNIIPKLLNLDSTIFANIYQLVGTNNKIDNLIKK